MLPLEILKGAKNKKVLVQIKNGDYINGILENVDTFMNLKITNFIYNNKEKGEFFKANEIFIRGNNISSLNFEENLLEEIIKEKELEKQMNLINQKQPTFLNKKRNEGTTRGRGGMIRGRGRDGHKKEKNVIN